MEIAGEWLLRLREDALSDAQMSEWIAWCEADPKNLEAFEELQALWRAAGEPVADEKPRARPRAPQPIFRYWPIAAVVAILAIGVSVFMTVDRMDVTRRVANTALVQAPPAGNRQATLPDGSQVDLGARSALDVNFTDSRRELKLRDGQAFFQVKQDKNRPFVIDAGAIRIVALGTAFDVRRTANQIAITVQEGIIEATASAAASRPIQASAGYQLIFNPHTGQVRKSLVDPAVALAWRAGRLEFTGDPLDVVIASINRYSAHPVVLEDPALGQLTFTGTVFVDSIDASLNALGQVFPLTVHRDPQRIVLTRRP